MLERFHRAGLLWPGLATLVALAALLGLGTWQLQRKAWKEAIIAKIEARVHAPPVAIDSAMTAARAGEDVEYMHVSAAGTFDHDKERYLYAPEKEGLGWQVLTPLELGQGRIVWVNRGLVPDDKRSPAARPQGLVEGPTTVTGLVRMPKANAFTPSNDATRNIWHWADIGELTRSAYGQSQIAALPIVIEADASATPPGGLPRAGITRLQIPNRHLEYVLTWYGLALTLVGVFIAFARGRLRAPPPA